MKRLAPLLLAMLGGCALELVCPPGQANCGGTCVSLLGDLENCGACGVACGTLEYCSGGARTCGTGTKCDGVCTDTARDPDHCGSCTTACAPDELCQPEVGCVAAPCPGSTTACSRACVELATDVYHCGSCGNACARGQRCRSGQCRADLYVACMGTDEIVPVTTELAGAGPALATPGLPTDIAFLDSAVFSANVYPASVSVFPLDSTRSPRTIPIARNDLQRLEVHGNMLLLTNSDAGTVIVLNSDGDILDEIPLPGQQTGPNPHGIRVLGTTAWVALYGNDPWSGQAVAKLDLSTIGAGRSLGAIGLLQVPGAYDPPGLPLPDSVAVDADHVYVTLKNLADDPSDAYTFYAMPAGSGRLAVITPAANDDVSIVDLGPSCGSPGDIVLHGTTLWITCGAFSYAELAPHRLLPVDVSTAIPVLGTPIELGNIVPAKLAFCSGMGYVGDMASGAVVRFDPVARTADAPVDVCPPGLFYTSVADIACPQ